MNVVHRPLWLVSLRLLLPALATFICAPLAAQTTTSAAPLKLIVPFTPGTGIDLIARTLGP